MTALFRKHLTCKSFQFYNLLQKHILKLSQMKIFHLDVYDDWEADWIFILKMDKTCPALKMKQEQDVLSSSFQKYWWGRATWTEIKSQLYKYYFIEESFISACFVVLRLERLWMQRTMTW